MKMTYGSSDSVGRLTPSGRHHAAGFTLLELMIVVAVVAILAAIAMASYRDSVVKSRRATGAACLQERALFMERYYTTNLTYVGAPNPADCDNEVSPHYDVTFVGTPTAKAYTIQAEPQGPQEDSDTKCGTLTINAQGVRGESGTATTADECW